MPCGIQFSSVAGGDDTTKHAARVDFSQIIILAPGAYPTKSYKYWVTDICNYTYL
jgi:hypothetical protein